VFLFLTLSFNLIVDLSQTRMWVSYHQSDLSRWAQITQHNLINQRLPWPDDVLWRMRSWRSLWKITNNVNHELWSEPPVATFLNQFSYFLTKSFDSVAVIVLKFTCHIVWGWSWDLFLYCHQSGLCVISVGLFNIVSGTRWIRHGLAPLLLFFKILQAK